MVAGQFRLQVSFFGIAFEHLAKIFDFRGGVASEIEHEDILRWRRSQSGNPGDEVILFSVGDGGPGFRLARDSSLARSDAGKVEISPINSVNLFWKTEKLVSSITLLLYNRR